MPMDRKDNDRKLRWSKESASLTYMQSTKSWELQWREGVSFRKSSTSLECLGYLQITTFRITFKIMTNMLYYTT